MFEHLLSKKTEQHILFPVQFCTGKDAFLFFRVHRPGITGVGGVHTDMLHIHELSGQICPKSLASKHILIQFYQCRQKDDLCQEEE
jgi:hypothetical protein